MSKKTNFSRFQMVLVILALTLSLLPMGIQAAATDLDLALADFDALTSITSTNGIVKSISDFANDGALPSTGSVNGSTITWTVDTQSVAGNFTIDANQVGAITRPASAISATTGAVTPANDNFVTIKASIQNGNAFIEKPFYVIVKREDKAEFSNAFLDDFSHQTITTKWKTVTPAMAIDSTAVGTNSTDKAYLTSADTSLTYTSDNLPGSLAQNVQLAGFRGYFQGTTSGAAMNFILTNGHAKEAAYVRFVYTAGSGYKVTASNNEGGTVFTKAFNNTSGTQLYIPLSTWFEVRTVVNNAGNFIDGFNSAYYDVYVYGYDYTTGERTLMGSCLGLKARALNIALDVNKQYIKKLQVNNYKMNNAYYDDFYLTNLSADCTVASNAITLPAGIYSKTKLPIDGANGTKISWAIDKANVTISEDGTVICTDDNNVSNATLTATITKSENITGAINASATKTINNFNITARIPSNMEMLAIDKEQLVIDQAILDNVAEIDSIGELTAVCPKYGSTVVWSSSDNAIKIADNAVTEVNRPSGSDKLVTLTATLTKGDETTTKTFIATVKKIVTDADRALTDYKALTVDQNLLNNVVDTTSIPNLLTNGEVYYSFISWASTDPAIVITNNVVSAVSRPTDVDKMVTLQATVTFGDYSYTKPFYAIVKKTGTSTGITQLFKDDFETAPDSSWAISSASDIEATHVTTGTTGINATGRMSITSKKDVSNGIYSKTIPSTTLEGHVIEAGLKFYAPDIAMANGLFFKTFDDKSQMVSSVLLGTDTLNNIAFKFFKSGTNLSGWSYLTATPTNSVSINESSFSTDGKWYQLKSVIDYTNYSSDGINEYNPKQDMYLYECDASMNPYKLLGYSTGALRSSVTTMGTRAISKFSIEFSKVNTDKGLFIDDVYVNDLTPAMLTAKNNLLLPKSITSSDKLPIVGVDNTKISYTSSNSDVTITADGTVTSTVTTDTTITATIVSDNFADFKASNGILPTVKKTFNVIVNQTPVPELTLVDNIVFSNVGGNDMSAFKDGMSVNGRVTLYNLQSVNAIIMIATYKADGTLQDVKMFAINNASGRINEYSTPNIKVNADTSTIKAFLWDDISGLKPINDVTFLQRGGQ